MSDIDYAAKFGCVCDGAGECFACFARSEAPTPPRPSLRERTEAALTAAYAEGRADEAAERAPVTAALLEALRDLVLADEAHALDDGLFDKARAAIRLATEVTEPVPAKEET